MDILDRLLEHDAGATHRLLTLCLPLSTEQWQQTFDFGQGSLYDTFDHCLDSAEYWTSLMQGQPGPFVPAAPDPARSLDSLVRRFEAVAPDFAAVSKQMRDSGRLDDTFVDTETGPVRRTFGACIVHVVTHNMHHRAQVLAMFDLMGVDYNPYGGYALDSLALN